MARRITLIFLFAFTIASFSASRVEAKARKIQLGLRPQPDLGAPNGLEPDASGRFVLNFAKGAGNTVIQLNCWDLTPGVEYTVFFYDGVAWKEMGVFTAKPSGSGVFHDFVPGNISGAVRCAVNKMVDGKTKAVLISD